MSSIYVALMDNGSGDMMVRGLSTDIKVALKRLQEDLIEWRGDELQEMADDGEVKDPSAPTLDEMKVITHNDVSIVEVPDGIKLYEQLREYSFEGCKDVSGDDPRLG